jgi:hypothetical protein
VGRPGRLADVLTPAALVPQEWVPRALAHEQRVDAWVQPHLDRRRSGQRHPVEDFLFDYYHLSPAKLRRWHPGAGVVLAGREAEAYLELASYRRVAAGVEADPDRLARHADRLRDVRRLLVATGSRPPSYGCFGLHEWAMVYRLDPDEVRHRGHPLRLGSAGTDAVVEQGPLRCTHIDAYRFFTPAATPRNAFRPTRASQPELEQPGCLHAGMDLYKWAYKLDPYVPSELVADCFELALDIRSLDMRASPYDLAQLGYAPVRIETPEGRARYRREQAGFTERARPLRARLIALCEELLG